MGDIRGAVSGAGNIAGVLHVGGRSCAGCCRSTPSLTDAWCCRACRRSPGVHDRDCDALFESREEQRPRGPLQFALSRPVLIGLLMETTVEATEPTGEFSPQELVRVADAVRCSWAIPYQHPVTVSSEGRFAVRCYGSVRVGCYLCRTQAMSGGCWFSHARSKTHAQALARKRLSHRSADAPESPADPFDQLLVESQAAHDGESAATLRAMKARDRHPGARA